jgi:glycosyltransferase involved in cell wall biosynthesis
MPLVSVVMPSYNHERFITQSIASVLGQEFDDLELIIVDDASTDNSRQIIQKYAVEDARVRVIFHETNCGISKTMNDGIAAAKGKFLGETASDDVWKKDKLSKQLAVLESNEDLIVFTEVEIIDESGQPVGLTWSEFNSGVSAKKTGDIFHDLLGRWEFFMDSNMLLKRANLGDIRYDESLKYANDYKLDLELAARYEFYFIPEPLVQYRSHASNTCGTRGFQGEANRVDCEEDIMVLEYALSQWRHRMSAKAKATAFTRLAFRYYQLGQNRKALMCFCQAFAYDPFRRSHLQHPRRFLKFTRGKLGLGTPERK